jgi:hypothetical protein
MSRLLWCLTGLAAAVYLAATAVPVTVEAYDAPCHEHATRQADSLWTFPELHFFMFTRVDEGSGCEDSEEHIYGSSGICGHTPRHMWDADLGDFHQNNCVGWDYDNAWVKGRSLIDRAVSFYWEWINSGAEIARDSSYHYLGHACHLMEDMAAPCHAKVDYHDGVFSGDACYEDWMCCADCEDNMNSPCLQRDFGTWWKAEERWGHFYVDRATSDMAAAYLGGECWEPKELQASYYYLMYTTNQVTEYFASDSYDGDMDVRPGWGIDYTGFPATPTITSEISDNDDGDDDDDGDLTNIASVVYTKAISSVAALYRAWRDYWDDVNPTTYATFTGPAEVHDGWRPDNVMITLNADDNSMGGAVHDSGIDHILWWKDGSESNYIYQDHAYVSVAAEGITPVYYRAMDWFGNCEAIKSQIVKIDKTPPEAAIISPTHDGFYLTDGSFTIDYQASDVPSGIYALTADLDGEPVADGQVFDDLSNMAGYHVVTVRAEDYAGNVTAASVSISIKIDASVYFQPEVLSTKSNGEAFTAHVGFPSEYDVRLIDPPTATLTVEGTVVPAKPWPSTAGHKGPDGLLERILQFDREPVCDALAGITDEITMTVYGRLVDSVEFYGTGDVDVFTPPRTGGTNGTAAESGMYADNTGAEGLPADAIAIPARLTITGASPNPFSESVAIRFGLPRDGAAQIDLFDVSGHLVTGVFQGDRAAGYQTVTWQNDGSIGTGVYFLRLRSGADAATRKVVISR